MSALHRVTRKVLLTAIRAYQIARTGRLSPCRFTPSCSEYAAEAIETFGALRGSILAMKRVTRCNPLGGHGFDPVVG